MAIKLTERYPGKTAGVNADYPLGQARNITTPGDGTGTPFDAALVNDDQGFKQALLAAAGLVATGNPDTAVASQYLQALQALFLANASMSFNSSGNGQIVVPIAGKNWTLKWGTTGFIGATNTKYTQNFPEAFPTACLFVHIGTVTQNASGVGSQKSAQLVSGSVTAAKFGWFADAWNNNSTLIAASYIAIGY